MEKNPYGGIQYTQAARRTSALLFGLAVLAIPATYRAFGTASNKAEVAVLQATILLLAAPLGYIAFHGDN